MNIEPNTIYNMECIEGMQHIKDKTIDMILCDLPYGMTDCLWDTNIPLDSLWEQYTRIIKDSGVIALTASQPFTSKLVMSNLKNFKYEWIWEKNRGSNFASVKYMPMKEHESILIFYKNRPTYNEQKIPRSEGGRSRSRYQINVSNTGKKDVYHGLLEASPRNLNPELRCPRSIVKFNCEVGLHPTQKPVALFEYLIKTYTNEGETVLDNCIGSGTTAVACRNTNRKYIGFEIDPKYFNIAKDRLKQTVLTV